jgi:hypothetical protein
VQVPEVVLQLVSPGTVTVMASVISEPVAALMRRTLRRPGEDVGVKIILPTFVDDLEREGVIVAKPVEYPFLVTVNVTDVVGIFVQVLSPLASLVEHEPVLGVTEAPLTRFPLISLMTIFVEVVIGRIEIVAEADPDGPTVTVAKPDSYCWAAVTGDVAVNEYEPVGKDERVHSPSASVTAVHWLTLIPAIGEPSTELTTETTRSSVVTEEVMTTVAPFSLTSDHVGVTEI